MSDARSSFLAAAQERGFIHQCTDRDALAAKLAAGPVTDSYWAARTGRPNTGHALPAPSSEGPLPLDVELAAGDA